MASNIKDPPDSFVKYIYELSRKRAEKDVVHAEMQSDKASGELKDHPSTLNASILEDSTLYDEGQDAKSETQEKVGRSSPPHVPGEPASITSMDGLAIKKFNSSPRTASGDLPKSEEIAPVKRLLNDDSDSDKDTDKPRRKRVRFRRVLHTPKSVNIMELQKYPQSEVVNDRHEESSTMATFSGSSNDDRDNPHRSDPGEIDISKPVKDGTKPEKELVIDALTVVDQHYEKANTLEQQDNLKRRREHLIMWLDELKGQEIRESQQEAIPLKSALLHVLRALLGLLCLTESMIRYGVHEDDRHELTEGFSQFNSTIRVERESICDLISSGGSAVDDKLKKPVSELTLPHTQGVIDRVSVDSAKEKLKDSLQNLDKALADFQNQQSMESPILQTAETIRMAVVDIPGVFHRSTLVRKLSQKDLVQLIPDKEVQTLDLYMYLTSLFGYETESKKGEELLATYEPHVWSRNNDK